MSKHTSKNILNRILSILLSLVLLLGMLPTNIMNVSAATEEHPDVMTMTVTDGTAPIARAEVRIYTTSLGEDSFDLTKHTDENGLVVFEEITHIAEEVEEEFPFYYVINAEGYETSVQVGTMTRDSAAMHIDATLREKEKATLTVGLQGGRATVTIDGEIRGTKTAYIGDILNVVVTPAEGYYISAITVGAATVSVPEKGEPFRIGVTLSQDTMILVSLVRQYTVVGNLSEGGVLCLNGEMQTLLVADENATVNMKVVAADGYRIDSIFIGEEEIPDVLNLTEYETEFILTEDTVITVQFIHIWTVTVTHTGDGTVEIDPSAEGGSVTVLSGTAVSVSATPNPGCRVSGVAINGEDDPEVTGENDTGYHKELITDKEYFLEITFAPNVYRITAVSTTNGTIEPEQSSIDHGGNVKVYLRPLSGFTVESVSVNGAAIDSLSEDENGIYFFIENVTEHQEVRAAFKTIAVADSKFLDIDVSSALRIDAENRTYILKEGTSVIFHTTAQKIRVYDSNQQIIGTGDHENPVVISSSVTVSKVTLYYRDTYEFFTMWHTVKMNPMRIVIDKGDNVKAGLFPNIQPNAFGYYNQDVPFTVTAEDTGDYSGIALIEAWITTNGVKGEIQTLYTYTGGEICNTFSSTDALVVNANANSSDDVKVGIRVVDRAGNEATSEKAVKISVEIPTVELSITGSQGVNALPGYYNSDRVLTILVTDRADTFDASAIARGLKLTFNAEEQSVDPSRITWTHQGNVHTGNYVFSQDGTYSWGLNYTNKAGNSASEIIAPQDQNIFDFHIDKENPYHLSIHYEPGFIDTILEGITFGFYRGDVKVTITATDDTSGIESFQYTCISETVEEAEAVLISAQNITFNGQIATAEFTIAPQFRGKVSFTATDKAGHSTTLTDDARTLVVDTVAPGITVEYDDSIPQNGTFYGAPRSALIRITEDNFFHEDIADHLLTLLVTKKFADGSMKEENWTPTFVEDGNSYIATILFDEDADYTFDISYTDRAGNVCDSYPGDSFTIDLLPPRIQVHFDNNDCIEDKYFSNIRTATITIHEHNFRSSDVECIVTENGTVAERFNTYLQKEESWTHNGNVHTAQITFTGGAYTFETSYTDLAGHINESVDFGNSVAPNHFIVDTGAPSGLKINYAPTFVGNVLETLTFGFYKAPVTVTIEATDYTAGVDHFIYSYTLQENVSEVNAGMSDVMISSEDISYDGSRAYATFTIPAQFRGYVSFTATDRSGHSTSYYDDRVVVVDTIAPGITVSYDNLNAHNGHFFDSDRTATISVKESNFFAKDLEDGLLQINVTYTDLNGIVTTIREMPEFIKDGDNYTAQIHFAQNGDYVFDVSYTDRAGNSFNFYEEDVFTIDKLPPRLTVSYDQTQAVDGYYFKEDVILYLTVEEHNFRATDFSFDIEAFDITGLNSVDLSTKAYTSFLQNQDNWTRTGDLWTTQITLDAEGNYRLSADFVDLATLSQGNPVEASFCIDKTSPYDLKISYEPDFVGTILETLSFGFYRAPVTVTIEARDDFSGVDEFIYSYTVQEGASEINTGLTNVVVHKEDIVAEGNHASYSFDVPAQFRGNISFKAIDTATLEASLYDESILVVDSVAPGIHVSYDNNAAAYGSYYNANRTATITIQEANFFSQDIADGLLKITVGKTLNDGTLTVSNLTPEFSKNGDTYTAEILFSEDADYSFDISYTDRSGNVYDSYETDYFTIDKIDPVILVTYDNNNVRNNDQFNNNRIATIQITEHNFVPEQVTVQVTENGVPVDAYTNLLKDEASWTHNGDIHTATISYTDEAHYTFEIGCIDMAGNWNPSVDYGTSVAVNRFTIDKTAPDNLAITVDGKSVLGTNSVAFDTFYKEAITLRLSAKFDISGMESMEYQKVSAVSLYSENGTWKPYDSESGITVTPSEKFVLYFRARDRAGNDSIVNSTGIIVDNQMPTGEVNAPSIDILPSSPNENGIHSGDVTVNLKVLDPKYLGTQASSSGHYSGLQKITYRIYTTDTNEVQTGTLLDIGSDLLTGAVKDSDNLVSSWTGKITIDANRFNSNHVMVEVTALDNAGNIRTTTTNADAIRIDITAPRIDINYSNNAAENGTYFRADRTATVTITERNFNPSKVQITLSNRSGSIPRISDWQRTAGGGNGDADRWTATIHYNTDGEYQFDIAYTDQAGNVAAEASYGASVAPKSFIIDKTLPNIQVSYDNNEVFNKSYYQKQRIATIVIQEKNLDPNGADKARIRITMTATNDGVSVPTPVVSAWTTSGSQHTATITYSADAVYSFDIAVTDKAGNQSSDFPQQSFCIDQTAPEISITGVKNGSANASEVMPLISFSDVNFLGDSVFITLSASNKGEVEPEGTMEITDKGGSFQFTDFPNDKAYDDLYTLTAKITDAAGNVSEDQIMFSVNRFGSTYEISPEAQSINGAYVQSPLDIVITETNVDELETFKVTIFKNNETIILEKGKDFTVEQTGGEGSWYQYRYTIPAENFTDDGVYRVSIRSEDRAGNVAENSLDTKNSELTFGIDKTQPTVVVQNLESSRTYAVETLRVLFSANDNLLLDTVSVYLDNMTTPLKVWTAEEISEILSLGEDFSFDVPGDITDAHSVRFYCKDAAGNELTMDITDFYVTTNLFVRYWNNKGLFFGSIGGFLALVAGAILLHGKKKKQK